MSKLIDFVIANFSRLQPADYVLIALLAALLGVGIFSVFRWIYSALLSAKTELIKTKDDTIAGYKQNLELTERARNSAEQEADRLNAQIVTLEAAYEKASGDKAALAGALGNSLRNALMLTIIINRIHLIHIAFATLDIAKDALIMYQSIDVDVHAKFPEAPRARDLYRAIAEIETLFDTPLDAIHTLVAALKPQELVSRPLSLPEPLAKFNTKVAFGPSTDLIRQMHDYLRRTLKG